MSYLIYLMFRCDRRCDGCDGKFRNFVGTKHTLGELTHRRVCLAVSVSLWQRLLRGVSGAALAGNVKWPFGAGQCVPPPDQGLAVVN